MDIMTIIVSVIFDFSFWTRRSQQEAELMLHISEAVWGIRLNQAQAKELAGNNFSHNWVAIIDWITKFILTSSYSAIMIHPKLSTTKQPRIDDNTVLITYFLNNTGSNQTKLQFHSKCYSFIIIIIVVVVIIINNITMKNHHYNRPHQQQRWYHHRLRRRRR